MTHRRLRVLLALGVSSTLAACTLVFSLDDYAAPTLAVCSSCAANRCQCAPNAPTGFDYARLRVPAKTEDVCPSGTVAGVAMGQGVEDDGCECACDSPAAGAACSLAIFAGKGCKGSPVQSIALGACTALGTSGDSSAAVLPAAGKACPVHATLRPPAFTVPVLVCLDPLPGDSGCDERTTCTAAPGPPFEATACIIAKPGAAVSCPDSYSHKYLFATEFDDQRSCDSSACACSPQECPDTTVSLCQDPACQASCGVSGQNFLNCKDFAGLTHGQVVSDGKTVGKCEASGEATSSGSVATSGLVTVCCRNALPKGT